MERAVAGVAGKPDPGVFGRTMKTVHGPGEMRLDDPDIMMRTAAFEHVRGLSERNDLLTSKDLANGFIFRGERIPLVNPRGIFKPKRMQYLLSIRTAYLRPGARILYDDQKEVLKKIFEGHEVVDYAFMKQNPNSYDNQLLRVAYEKQIPVIYFIGVASGSYLAIPILIAGWNADALKAQIAFKQFEQKIDFGNSDLVDLSAPQTAPERRYVLRNVKQRLHQRIFRDAVIGAYNGRCALSGFSVRRLLDAAHIIPDKDEQLGQPVVRNGLPLSKIHHAAFDAHLIGVDPDYRLHVSERLLTQHDGPMLEALKRLKGQELRLPTRAEDYPDPERLEMRFDQFKAAA